MRLALITQDFPPEIGGIQTYCLEIAQRMHKKCDDFIIIAPQKEGAEQVDRDLPFKVHRVATPNTLLGLAAIPEMLPILEKRDINTTFHAQWLTIPISVAAANAGIVKQINVAAHARELFFNPYGKKNLLGRTYELYKQYLLKKADHFFPVSNYTAGVLNDHGISQNKIDVVINGTNPDLFHPLDTGVDKLKEELGVTRKKVVLSISRLIDRKGVDTAIKAVAQLVTRLPDLHYVIVGDGPQRPYLEQLTADLDIKDHVTFAGWIPYTEVTKYYNLCDLFVMASKTQLPEIEAFGIVYLEANACGKPVIGTKTGGISDAVKDGETGILVEEQNPAELSAAMHKLLTDELLRTQLGNNGRKWVLNKANWDWVAQTLYNHMNKSR